MFPGMLFFIILLSLKQGYSTCQAEKPCSSKDQLCQVLIRVDINGAFTRFNF